jgi:hypothetical protein
MSLFYRNFCKSKIAALSLGQKHLLSKYRETTKKLKNFFSRYAVFKEIVVFKKVHAGALPARDCR